MSSPRGAWALTLAGLIPFVGLAAASVAGAAPFGLAPQPALAAYGACILSFLGGARWGLALARDGVVDGGELARATVPSLVGWAAILSPAVALNVSFLILAFGLAAMWIWDVASAVRRGAPSWYPQLRTVATAGAVSSLATAAIWGG
ncbi:MAG: DUF3429 domain-containing protein [Pseudomonadota bacterium]